jgi:hypothetical protein
MVFSILLSLGVWFAIACVGSLTAFIDLSNECIKSKKDFWEVHVMSFFWPAHLGAYFFKCLRKEFERLMGIWNQLPNEQEESE